MDAVRIPSYVSRRYTKQACQSLYRSEYISLPVLIRSVHEDGIPERLEQEITNRKNRDVQYQTQQVAFRDEKEHERPNCGN